ncbi:MAG: hypothetical protein H0T60_19230 [Acidobacteria bacterium]|nr:hypothetical protein [Acidobacteriota bacterium]
MTVGYVVICKGWTMKLCEGREMPVGGMLLYARTSTLFTTRVEAVRAIERSKKHKADHPLHDKSQTFIVRMESP